MRNRWGITSVCDAGAARQSKDGQALLARRASGTGAFGRSREAEPLDEGLRIWFPDGDEIRLQGAARALAVSTTTRGAELYGRSTRGAIYAGAVHGVLKT